jgi:hypothetical protein
MIIYPAACSDILATLVDASQSAKAECIIIQNRTGGHPVALRWDGSTGTLTYDNGMLLNGGEERVINIPAGKGSFTNVIEGICGTGFETDLIIHVIE